MRGAHSGFHIGSEGLVRALVEGTKRRGVVHPQEIVEAARINAGAEECKLNLCVRNPAEAVADFLEV